MFLLASLFYFMDQVPENPEDSAVAAAVPAEDNNVANDPAPPNAAAPVSHQVSFLLFMFASIPGFVPACALSGLYSYYAISLFGFYSVCQMSVGVEDISQVCVCVTY